MILSYPPVAFLLNCSFYFIQVRSSCTLRCPCTSQPSRQFQPVSPLLIQFTPPHPSRSRVESNAPTWRCPAPPRYASRFVEFPALAREILRLRSLSISPREPRSLNNPRTLVVMPLWNSAASATLKMPTTTCVFFLSQFRRTLMHSSFQARTILRRLSLEHSGWFFEYNAAF